MTQLSDLYGDDHTITSHIDTTASGSQLNELVGGGDTTLHDHDGISENTAARHTESHNIASHSDTTATGAELDTLTDGSDTSLHIHDSRYYTESEIDTISGSLQTNINAKPDTLLELTDTPSSYSSGLYLKSTTSGTEWATTSGSGGVDNTEDNIWSETQLYNDNSLTCASTTTWDMETYQNTYLLLTENTTLSGTVPGSNSGYYTVLIKNNGAYILTLDSQFLTSAGEDLENTTTSGAVDVINVYLNSGNLYATLSPNFS